MNLTQKQISEVISILSSSQTESPTFREYGLKAIEATAQNRSVISQRDELKRLKALCLYFGDMKISDISPSIILEWQNSLNISSKTIRSYRGTLSTILKFAFANGFINANPLIHTKPPRKEHKEVKIFSKDEIELLLTGSSGQFHNILYFNFFMGLRGSELIALKWCDVDFKAKKVSINRRIRERDIDKPKGYKTRVIDLMPQALEALLNQWEMTNSKEYIFVTEDKGTPYTIQDTLSKRLRKLCKTLCITPKGFHTVRKTCNTLYRQHGFNTTWIMQQMGHSSEEVNIYHYTGKVQLDSAKANDFGQIVSLPHHNTKELTTA
jgi:integrase